MTLGRRSGYGLVLIGLLVPLLALLLPRHIQRRADGPVQGGLFDERQRLDRRLRQQPDGVSGASPTAPRRAPAPRTKNNNSYNMVHLDVGRRSRHPLLVVVGGGRAAPTARGAVGRPVLGRPSRAGARAATTPSATAADEAAGAGRRRLPDDHRRRRLFGPTSTSDRAYQGVRQRHRRSSSGRPRAPTSAPTCRRRQVRTATPAGRWWSSTAPVAAAAQPHRVRRARRRRAERPAVDHDLRVHAPADRHGQRPARAWSPTRATTARPVTGPNSPARSWRRRCRRAPTSSTAPTTTTARWSRAGTRPTATCSASTSRTSTRPASSATAPGRRRIDLASTSERYFPGVVTTAIDVFAPDFSRRRRRSPT